MSPNPPAGSSHRSQIKETLVSIIIAFALAFVFRAFVIEAFVIPTGSMAPTLMGAHMRFTSPSSGYSWPVGPWEMDRSGQAPTPVQRGPIRVQDPMTGEVLERRNVTRRSGDRILVFKYLRPFFSPGRWDVVVFKAPTQPQTNYIKRLIGLPGETIAIVDGDVFVRPPEHAAPGASVDEIWALDGWEIARKPERVQRAVWQPVHDSRYAPVGAAATTFRSPWTPATRGWARAGHALEHPAVSAGATAVLAWNPGAEIGDYYPYNQGTPGARTQFFPVSDLRMRCTLRPGPGGLRVSAIIGARQHEFRGTVDGTSVTVSMRPRRPDQGDADHWVVLGAGEIEELAEGQAAEIEFWHADHALEMWVCGRRVATGTYDWSPALRILRSTGVNIAEVVARQEESRGNVLMDPRLYERERPTLRWEFGGVANSADAGPFRVETVALDRDLHYQAAAYMGHYMTGEPASATHPVSTVALEPDHFFVCGDNSPQSEDGRLWGAPEAWVAETVDPAPSVVARDLMIGKAFFVYFPSLLRETRSPLPAPDFGRMRFIW